jgi:hypothetical protein
MKKLLGLTLVCSTILLSSFTAGIEIDEVVGALKLGNASQLSRYFDSRVDITLPDKSDNYSRTQAEMILRNFFSNSGVKNFEIKYKGESNGSHYCIGTLHTRSGDFRTKLFMKNKSGKDVVQEIAFQPLY